MDNKENETLKPDNQNNNISETEKIPKVTNYSKKANGIILKNLIAFVLIAVAVIALYPVYAEWGIPYNTPYAEISTELEANYEGYNTLDYDWDIWKPVIGEDLLPLCTTDFDNATRIISGGGGYSGMFTDIDQLNVVIDGYITVEDVSDESIKIKTNFVPCDTQKYFSMGDDYEITLRTGESVELVASTYDSNIVVDKFVVKYDIRHGKLTVGDLVNSSRIKIANKWKEFKYNSPFI